MDYNVVRRRKKGKKEDNTKYIITIAALLVICGLVTAALVMAIEDKRKSSGSVEEQTETNIPEETQYEPEDEIPARVSGENNEPAEETEEPVIITPEPISGEGRMEPIPQDVWAYMQGRSWKENNYVGYDDLMYLTLPYYDFNYTPQTGHMVCARDVAEDVVSIFAELFEIKYPIERMEPIDYYFDGLSETFDTPDRNSMGHNNTSCFCFRVVSGSSNLSNHAYGRAIDLNPMTNPWEQNGSVSPRNAYKYAQRARTAADTDFTDWSEAERAAFIGSDTEVYRIFKKYGWEWGGEIWGAQHDYQHFQKR